jgi:T-complex protein 1 subunit gamma
MQEEEEMKKLCDDIIKVKPDLVITEKGVSDLAQHFLLKANVSVIRRIRKTDTARIARVPGAHICNRTEELTESMVGTRCGLFQIKNIGDEQFAFLVECTDAKACTVVLRGASRDVLNEMERNLQDAFCVARNIILEPKLLPGGGATEMELSSRMKTKAKSIEGTRQYAYRAVADALEVIPRSLAHNCGADVVRVMTDLRSRHSSPSGLNFGIDGNKGVVADVKELRIMDTFAVKQQTIRTAVEAAAMLLRIDDIISGISKKKRDGPQQPAHEQDEPEQFGDARDG